MTEWASTTPSLWQFILMASVAIIPKTILDNGTGTLQAREDSYLGDAIGRK